MEILQECQVKPGIVGKHRQVLHELHRPGHDLLQRVSPRGHVGCDPGQTRDERINDAAGIDQCLKRGHGFPVHDLDHPDFQDLCLVRAKSGGFQVQHDVGIQGCKQFFSFTHDSMVPDAQAAVPKTGFFGKNMGMERYEKL